MRDFQNKCLISLIQFKYSMGIFKSAYENTEDKPLSTNLTVTKVTVLHKLDEIKRIKYVKAPWMNRNSEDIFGTVYKVYTHSCHIIHSIIQTIQYTPVCSMCDHLFFLAESLNPR